MPKSLACIIAGSPVHGHLEGPRTSKWARFGCAVALGLLLISVSASASVQKDFMRLWEGRAEQFTNERPTLEARAQRSANVAVQSINAGEPSAAQNLAAALNDARALSTLHGRYQILYLLHEHMARKPAEATTEAWLQSQIADIQGKVAATDQLDQQVRLAQPGKDVTLLQWVGAIERLAQERGFSEGAATELALIDQNLRSYYTARAEEHEKAIQLRAAIFAAVLSGLASQQAATHDLGVQTVARSTGGGGYASNRRTMTAVDSTQSNKMTMCPDGSYVSGPCRMTPKGGYVGGKPTMAPDGSYVGGQPRMTPNGNYVGGGSGKTSLCPDGTYVVGRCKMTPNGRYVGE